MEKLQTQLQEESITIKKKSRKQNLNDILEVIQKKANEQMQDRICYGFIQSFEGYAFTVLDGHGSKQCAEFVHKNLNQKINRSFKQNQKLKLTLNHLVQKCLNQTFTQIQNKWFKIYKKHHSNFDFLRSGACYLTALISEKNIHIANAGDCQGVILGKGSPLKTNKRLNAGEKEQKDRLKRQFPFDNDIIVEKGNSKKTSCFVKGQLQPTRAIGDFELKDRNEFWGAKEDFNGPYIEFKPKVFSFQDQKIRQVFSIGK